MFDYDERCPVVGYEGLYEVSRGGNVFNVKTGEQKKSQHTKKGYMRLQLSRDDVVKNHYIHRLVATAWKPNPNNLPRVNHINGIRDDNRVDNLEWLSHSDDIKHSFQVLGRDLPRTMLGKTKPEKAGRQKRQVLSTHLKTGEKMEFESINEAARQLNGSRGNICLACQGRLKSAYGYRWEYVS